MSDTFKPYDTRDELKQTGVRFTEAEREVIEAAAKKEQRDDGSFDPPSDDVGD